MADGRGDWIHLTKFSFPCMLGLLEWEQREVQALDVELRLGLDLDQAAAGDLARSVNYAATLEEVQFIAQQGRWFLLESMSAAIARHVLAPPLAFEKRAQVSEVIVRLSKPEVFKGRAVPGVEIRRDADWARPRTSTVQGAQVAVLQETPQTGAYRVHVAGRKQWAVPPGMTVFVIAGRGVHGKDVIQPGMSLPRAESSVITTADEDVLLLAVSQPPLAGSN